MMNKGVLDAIFSTSTVAAGVNFPARTVVILNSDRFNGREFADLTATELHQMIGRAGRRGKDHIGFVLIVPGTYQKPKLIQELKDSQPEPLLSQIHINFSMTLNLLLSHAPLEVKDLLEHSFAAFQESEAVTSLMRRWDSMLSELKSALKGGKCDTTDPYEVWDYIEKRSDLHKRIKKLKRSFQYGQTVTNVMAHIEPGRLFLHRNGNVYAIFKTVTDQGRLFAMAHNIRKSAQVRKHRFRLRRIDLNQIVSVFDYQVDIPGDYTPEGLDTLFRQIAPKDLVVLERNEGSPETEGEQTESSKVEEVEEQLRSMPCETCNHLKTCHGRVKSPFRKMLRDIQMLTEHMAGTGRGLWLSFKRHLRFLRETGFVDDNGRLTPDGFWASKLRLDQPLVIADAIRKGGLDGVSPEVMAGGLAPFVWDRIQEVNLTIKWRLDLTELETVFYRVLDQIEEIRTLKRRRGFDNPQIMFWPAVALFLWAKGVQWEQLLEFVSVNEGDLASLIIRTADHLRQVVNLKETHPELASVAEKAIELILREPVYID